MSFAEESTKGTTRPFELDGSDQQDRQTKSQSEHVRDVKAHLAAAHASLGKLTGATLQDLTSDPELDPVYVGCVRELLGLGLGAVGLGALRKAPERLQSPPPRNKKEERKEESAAVPIATAVEAKPPKAPLFKTLDSSTSTHLTIHFLPDGAFGGKPPNVPPSVFDQRLVMSLEGGISQSLRGVSISGKGWTSRGDLVLSITKPRNVVKDGLLHGFKADGTLDTMFDDNWKERRPTTYRLRFEGETSCYLRIHDIPEDMFPALWWRSRISDIQECLTAGVLNTLKVPYITSPYYFQSNAKTVSTGKGKVDCFVDLSGIAKTVVDNLRRVCPTTIKSAALPNRPFTAGFLNRVFPISEWDGRDGLYDLTISLLEFKDEIV